MMRPIILMVSFLFFFLLSSIKMSAQLVVIGKVVGKSDPSIGKDNYKLTFAVIDDFTGARIPNVKAYLMTKDSITIDSLTSKNGNCSFKMKRDKNIQSCIIKLTHPNYYPLYSAHSLKYVGKQNNFSLPDLNMKRRSKFTDHILDEVVVTATKVKMYYRGDTLVYNADAFNVADGSMLDALIKQMPGTELTKEGEIFVNGRKVDNLLLNGKDFFRGKNKLMLENLPYFTIKDIKVYDKTTDKALALHDESADKDYVMDVNLKREYSKGYMANIELGAGTEDAYLARLFALCFTDVSRLAVVGGLNNLNKGAYSMSGYENNSGSRDGRVITKLLSAELMTEHKRTKNVMTVDLTHKKTNQGSDVFEETYHSEASTFSVAQSSNVNRNMGALFTNNFTLKMPIWMESNTSVRFNYAKDATDDCYYESGSDTRSQGLSVLDSLFRIGVSLNDPSMISARKRWVRGKTKDYGASQGFSISKKLYSGDLVEFNTHVDYNKSTRETDRFNSYLAWKTSFTQTDISEAIDRPNTHVGVDADVLYKNSRLFYDTNISLVAGYRYNRDKDKETILDAVSLVPDLENSYDRRMTENRYNMGIKFRKEHLVRERKLKTRIDLNVPLEIVIRRTNYKRLTVDTCLTQSPVFFEPSLTIKHSKWQGDNANNSLWSLSASTSLNYNIPDATQLITLPLTSDRINIYEGNAHLKSPATWRSSLSWDLPVKDNNAYLQQSLTYTKHLNRIVNTYRYDAGVYVNRPDNINGTWNLEFTTRGQQFASFLKLPITINYSLNSNYQRLKNFAADGATGKSLQIDNNELHNYAHIQLRSYYKSVTVGFRLSADWRKPLNDRADMGYRDTWDYKGDFWLSAKLPLAIDWETECVVLKRQGYSSDDLNKLTCDWNMGLSKSILKNKIGLSLKAIDILHQYKSVAYVVNERGIRETHAIALPSYWLFTVTYKFNKQPAKK